MASDDIRGIKFYLGRKFETGGGGIVLRGQTYLEGETGLKALADAVFATANEEIVITSTSFEGGTSSGQVRFSKTQMLTAIEELLIDMGFGSSVSRNIAMIPDYSEGLART